MKNAAAISLEIQELNNEIKIEEAKDFVSLKEVNKKYRNIKKLRSKIEYLNGILVYVETNPSEEFLNSELIRVRKAIDVRESSYKPLHEDTSLASKRKHKKEYDKNMGTPKLLEQEAALEYILGEK